LFHRPSVTKSVTKKSRTFLDFGADPGSLSEDSIRKNGIEDSQVRGKLS
jgi:hypothetical protein